MTYAADLHIHTALSPCADADMTPNNIVNMALLSGLDFIAITDHNTAANVESVCRCAAGTGLVVVPGIEVETSEEVHLVCLFTAVDAAGELQKSIELAMDYMPNRKDIFGSQLIMDENDNVTGELERLLLTSSGLSIEDVVTRVSGSGGIVIPAHTDRESYSIMSNLGAVPESLGIHTLEISRECDAAAFLRKHPGLMTFRLLKSSDAHSLGDILERESLLELEEKSLACLFSALK